MIQKLVVATGLCCMLRPLIHDNLLYLGACAVSGIVVGVILAKIK